MSDALGVLEMLFAYDAIACVKNGRGESETEKGRRTRKTRL